jgi:hypothetical protein
MDQQEALDQIKVIRRIMESVSQQMFFSPWQWIEWGVLGILGSLATIYLWHQQQVSEVLFLWIAIFVVGGVAESSIWLKSAQRRGVEPFHPFVKKTWSIAGLIMLLALILSAVFIRAGQLLYLPGLWLLDLGVIVLVIVILISKKEMLLIGGELLAGGVLAVSLLLDDSILVFLVCFGFGSLVMGIYMLIVERKISNKQNAH